MQSIPVLPYDVETVLKSVAEKRPIIQPLVIDVVIEDGRVVIRSSVEVDHIYLTPHQAVALMKEIRRNVVKISPKALRK